MQPVTQPPRGIRLKVWHILAFIFALAVVTLVVRDGLFGTGVSWWTLFEIAVASAIAGGGVLWFFARAKRKTGNGSGGTA